MGRASDPKLTVHGLNRQEPLAAPDLRAKRIVDTVGPALEARGWRRPAVSFETSFRQRHSTLLRNVWLYYPGNGMKQNVVQGSRLITQALQSAGLSRPEARKAAATIKRAWRLALLRENELHLPGVAVRLVWRKPRPTRRLRWRAGKLKQFGTLPPTTDRLRQRVAGSSRSSLVFRLDSVGEWYAVPRTIDRHRQRPWSSMQLPPAEIRVNGQASSASIPTTSQPDGRGQHAIPYVDSRPAYRGVTQPTGRFGGNDGIRGSRTGMFRR
jgi:hypothetical protein